MRDPQQAVETQEEISDEPSDGKRKEGKENRDEKGPKPDVATEEEKETKNGMKPKEKMEGNKGEKNEN